MDEDQWYGTDSQTAIRGCCRATWKQEEKRLKRMKLTPREEAFSEGGVDLVSAGLETFSKIGMKGKTMGQVIVTDNLVNNTVPA